MTENTVGPKRSGGRAARQAARATSKPGAVRPGLEGGFYRPLSDADVRRIHGAVIEVLSTIGMADASPELIRIACERGATLTPAGRLCFPPALVEDMLARAPREFSMHSRDGESHVRVGGRRVYFATSGEAISVFDPASRSYRPSTLLDIYDLARLCDVLDNIHQYGQPCVATDMTDPLERDLSIAYALAAGTRKTSGMSISGAENLKTVVAMFDMILGGEGRFVRRPFCSIGGCCPVVSPLRFARDSLDVLMETSRLGLVGDVAIAGQAGATAPVTLAGTLVQSLAETIACLMVVGLVRPGCPMMFGAWPLVSDLRTGSFTGGSGEQALLMAAVAQMANFYNLPGSVAAGMTDAKLPDNQAGFEKGVTTTIVALAGGNFVSESAGMLASLIGVSYEALVIDNDMLGSVQRTLRGIEVNEETLSVEMMREVASGAGHYLGHAETLEKMESEYLYPRIADRRSPESWREAGAKDIHEVARLRVRETLSRHYPVYIDPKIDAEIRSRFPIRLRAEDMRAGNGRW
jgi:trimethylamine--corrinoid protein Co-methyltransferase